MQKDNSISSEFIGVSIPVVELRHIIRQVAPTDVTILITGESGVGKEVVASEIYRLSKRNGKPFVTVNCGAIPEGIIESELFGHQKGSFTGAIESRKGYFELANGGTIFLDEIGELPLPTQVKFLRVIENGEYMKVGGNKTEKVNVRIIAATNKNLENQISTGHFREDLYYRLRSININIPPLRERKEDIPILFEYFVNQFCERNNIKFHGIDDEAIKYITEFSWPGNIRQLKNFTESLITLNAEKLITRNDVIRNLNIPNGNSLPAPLTLYKEKDDKQLLLRALFELKTDIMDVKSQLASLGLSNISITKNEPTGLFIEDDKIDNYDFEDLEREILTYYWNKYNGNVNTISDKLNISTRTLYRKFKTYELKNGRKRHA